MKRFLGILGALLVVGLVVPGASPRAVVASSSVASATQPRSQLRNASCHNAVDPQNRSLAVTAVMRPVTGTQKLQLKFDLLSAVDGSSRQTIVRAGNLGRWLTPKNSTLGQLADDVWSFRKSVFQPDAPATYRFRVSFRWLGAQGRVLGSAVRSTKSCRQRELRPDLAVSSITVEPVAGHPDQNLYVALISNSGGSAAGPFDVEFNPNDNSAPQTQTIERLKASSQHKAYSQQTLTFKGPVCDPANPPQVIADSAAQINDDLNPNNNSMYAVCPGSTAG
jgi:hypothetical protein